MDNFTIDDGTKMTFHYRVLCNICQKNINFICLAFLAAAATRTWCALFSDRVKASVQNAFAHVRTVSFFTLKLQHMALGLAASLY